MRVPDMWKSLPDDIVDAQSMNAYKNEQEQRYARVGINSVLKCLAPYGTSKCPVMM
jgi:hypothetical protein